MTFKKIKNIQIGTGYSSEYNKLTDKIVDTLNATKDELISKIDQQKSEIKLLNYKVDELEKSSIEKDMCNFVFFASGGDWS